MSFYSLTPPEQLYHVEVNGKGLGSEFSKLLDAEKTAQAYRDEGFIAIIFDTSTGQIVGSLGN